MLSSFDLIRQGGPVLWIILGCGLLAFGVFVERALHLHRARIRAEDFLKGIFTVLKRNNVNEAAAICDETPGPIAQIVKTAIQHRHDAGGLREAVEDTGRAEISRMERRLVVIVTVAQMAPLLGLLGTVLGMVEFVLVMRQHGELVQSADIMDGLMKALLTTGAGLAVAIPCFAAFNLLVVKIDRIVLDMEKAVSEIVAFMTSPEAPAEAGKKKK